MSLSYDVLAALGAGRTVNELAEKFGKPRAAIFIILERHRWSGRASRKRLEGKIKEYRYYISKQGRGRLKWMKENGKA